MKPRLGLIRLTVALPGAHCQARAGPPGFDGPDYLCCFMAEFGIAFHKIGELFS